MFTAEKAAAGFFVEKQHALFQKVCVGEELTIFSKILKKNDNICEYCVYLAYHDCYAMLCQ